MAIPRTIRGARLAGCRRALQADCIGWAWALIQPLLTVVVFTVIFGKLAKMPAVGTAAYALLVYAGLLPRQLFATSLTGTSNSLIGNANPISKVNSPRLIVSAGAVAVAFVDFLIRQGTRIGSRFGAFPARRA
jgi:lipopolysaccharide transport system permease protein